MADKTNKMNQTNGYCESANICVYGWVCYTICYAICMVLYGIRNFTRIEYRESSDGKLKAGAL